MSQFGSQGRARFAQRLKDRRAWAMAWCRHSRGSWGTLEGELFDTYNFTAPSASAEIMDSTATQVGLAIMVISAVMSAAVLMMRHQEGGKALLRLSCGFRARQQVQQGLKLAHRQHHYGRAEALQPSERRLHQESHGAFQPMVHSNDPWALICHESRRH